jgi:hypothetical protein
MIFLSRQKPPFGDQASSAVAGGPSYHYHISDHGSVVLKVSITTLEDIFLRVIKTLTKNGKF